MLARTDMENLVSIMLNMPQQNALCILYFEENFLFQEGKNGFLLVMQVMVQILKGRCHQAQARICMSSA
jgi:hypothetical protein